MSYTYMLQARLFILCLQLYKLGGAFWRHWKFLAFHNCQKITKESSNQTRNLEAPRTVWGNRMLIRGASYEVICWVQKFEFLALSSGQQIIEQWLYQAINESMKSPWVVWDHYTLICLQESPKERRMLIVGVEKIPFEEPNPWAAKPD